MLIFFKNNLIRICGIKYILHKLNAENKKARIWEYIFKIFL